MIYILVQEVSDDSDCGCSQGRPVFAHHDKKVIEKVHAAIQENFKRWNELAKRWSNDVEKIRKLMPRPTEPDYSKLPPRPLVWKDDINRGWNNAFLEYSEQVSLHDHHYGPHNWCIRSWSAYFRNWYYCWNNHSVLNFWDS